MSYFLLFFGVLLSLTSQSWILLWLGIELSVLGLLTLTLLDPKSSMKYYLIQSLGSCGILFSGLYKLDTILSISLMLKLGLAPFFWWVPKVISSLELKNSFLILTWMKVPSLTLLTTSLSDNMIVLSSVLSILVGSWLGMKSTKIMNMLSYSSVSQTGWISISLLVMKSWIYFIFYTLSIVSVIYNSKNLGMMNLAGLPPFLLFWAKIKVLMMLDSFYYYLLILSMIFSMLFYLKFCMKYTLNFSYMKLGPFLFINLLSLPLIIY